jgi:hypothetical protein
MGVHAPQGLIKCCLFKEASYFTFRSKKEQNHITNTNAGIGNGS